jgi:hypothetical protein
MSRVIRASRSRLLEPRSSSIACIIARPERRAVDEDPALARPGALDHADTLRPGRGAGVQRERRPERGEVEGDVADLGWRRAPPRGERVADPGIGADLGHAPQTELATGRHVGEPADVGPVPIAAELDRAHRLAVERAIELDVETGRRPDPHLPVARWRIAIDVGRTEPGR